jgi:hypothetical protein
MYKEVHMPITTGDILRLAPRLIWNAASDIVNVYHLKVLADGGQDTYNIIAKALVWMEKIYSEFDDLLANNATFADIAVANLTADESYGAQAWPTLTAGLHASPAINPGMGLFVWAPTVKPRCMAKKWIAPLTEDANLDGVWDASDTAQIAAALAILMINDDAGDGVVFQPVIPHYFENKVELDPHEYIPYTSVNATNVAGFQTRRRPGTGS